MNEETLFELPAEYKPISMWGYFGYEILFSIPLIGTIALLIACFVPKNKNLKNFARSYFCFLIIVFALIVLLGYLTAKYT